MVEQVEQVRIWQSLVLLVLELSLARQDGVAVSAVLLV
jgi:hypothetical protein